MDLLTFVTAYEFVVSLLMGLGAVCFFAYAVISGLFKDVESIKYRVYELEVKENET